MNTFKVVRIYRNSSRRSTLRRNLTEAEAQKMVAEYPNTEKSMVSYFREK